MLTEFDYPKFKQVFVKKKSEPVQLSLYDMPMIKFLKINYNKDFENKKKEALIKFKSYLLQRQNK